MWVLVMASRRKTRISFDDGREFHGFLGLAAVGSEPSEKCLNDLPDFGWDGMFRATGDGVFMLTGTCQTHDERRIVRSLVIILQIDKKGQSSPRADQFQPYSAACFTLKCPLSLIVKVMAAGRMAIFKDDNRPSAHACITAGRMF